MERREVANMIKVQMCHQNSIHICRGESDLCQYSRWIFPTKELIARHPVLVPEPGVNQHHVFFLTLRSADEDGVKHGNLDCALVTHQS